MNRSEFEAKLNKAYDGAVRPLNSSINQRATVCFKCEKCGLVFFGKPFHMVGKDHQRHVCGVPYGDKNGERLQHAGGRRKSKKKEPSITIDQFKKLVWEDYTPQQIAQKMQVNPKIVIYYFKHEGLI
ncbi:adenylate kinase [Bacillus velezensis]|uniref:adenylate kinase n=1 Tax=Bacillus velezensis TaxID=492670 RepID=UPI0025C95FC7|nr:adenylate kinase [Bacillus velezensis]MDN4142197.1 adenylate kinase [Bacillus velezensis]